MAKEIEYGTVNIPAEAFDPKNTKTRISMMIEDDLLLALKDAAKTTPHGEYQTLMKEILRSALLGSKVKLRVPRSPQDFDADKLTKEQVQALAMRLRPELQRVDIRVGRQKRASK